MISIDLLGAATSQRLILPFYHAVSDKDILHLKHLYPVKDVKRFKQDLNFFLQNYIPVDIAALVYHVTQKDILYQNSFFLSFDDGLSEIYHVIAPILLEKGIPATFFLNSAFVDNKELFYRYKASLLVEALQTKMHSEVVLKKVSNCMGVNSPSLIKKQLLTIHYAGKHKLDEVASILDVDFTSYLKTHQPYLTSEQINTLSKQGFTIGAHSVDHPEYSSISLPEQLDQTRESVQFVQSEFSQEFSVFSFPFTDYGVSPAFFTKVFDPKQPLIDLSFGTAGMKNDCISKNLQRIPMERNTESAVSIIIKQYLYYMAKFPFGKNMIRRV